MTNVLIVTLAAPFIYFGAWLLVVWADKMDAKFRLENDGEDK